MNNSIYQIKKPINEKILDYSSNDHSKMLLEQQINDLKGMTLDIPLIIGGEEIYTENKGHCIIPHNHSHIIGTYAIAGEKELQLAVNKSIQAKREWENMSFEHRASIFLRAANLISGKYRHLMNAATIICQSKTYYQSEIDAICELVDFLRYNVYFAYEIYNEQPESTEIAWNRTEYRPLEGFVVSISPFNFTSIGGNLAIAPAIMGNVVNWKPASSVVYSNYFIMKILKEAGLPDGVINFVPCNSIDFSKNVIQDANLSGVHFTGSTQTFNKIWRTTGENLNKYKNYPKLVGETGGKDFIFAHSSADIEELASSMIRGSFEYQGQKCSAASRAYIPKSLWPVLKENLLSKMHQINIGNPETFSVYMGAVIDEKAFNKIEAYIDSIKNDEATAILYGGDCDKTKGYFISPTIAVTTNPKSKTMVEEIFGPVLTIFVYEDSDFEKTLQLCDESTPYALTGAIFGKDRAFIIKMEEALRYTAGNFYINEKPTGAVVGQQPFGGSRASGTNDKAGSKLNLYRWVNPRTIKENLSYNIDL
jgi:1-pyrroline-5-carboxylate dehydrogenase